jgi:hypothetical protein
VCSAHFTFLQITHLVIIDFEWEGAVMRENIDELIDDLIAREGGFVDHPADKGGPTRWGITQVVARRHGYMGQIEELPRSVAALIYEKQYWRAPGFDQVAQSAPKLAGSYLTRVSIWAPAQPSDFCNAR